MAQLPITLIFKINFAKKLIIFKFNSWFTFQRYFKAS